MPTGETSRFHKLLFMPDIGYPEPHSPGNIWNMKHTLLVVGLFSALFTLGPVLHAKDALDTSDKELERLKKLNATSQVVNQSDEELRKMMVGKWSTGRHEFAFKADGTYHMLPMDTIVKGKWKIENHKLTDDTGTRPIIEASHKLIVLKNAEGPYPFRYMRIE